MPTDPVTLRRRLEDVRGRSHELRSRRKTAAELVQACREAARAEPGEINPNSEAFQRAERSMRDLEAIETDLALVESEERFVLGQMAGVEGDSLTGRDSFLRDPSVLSELAQLAHSARPIGSMQLGPALTRDELLASFERNRMAVAGDGLVHYDGDSGRTAAFGGVVPTLRRPLTLLDVIPSGPLDNKSLPYVQEGPDVDSAAETAEGAVKPPGQINLTDAEAVAATMATWVKSPRQVLADVAGLQAVIQNRLVYGVQKRLESQVVNGDGTGDNILGVLNTAGIGDVAYTASELAADLSLDGIVTVLISGAQPTAVLLNPLDWAAALKQKSQGSGEYMSMGPFVQTAQAMWGVAVIPSPVIAQGTALVGDWTRGATVLVREGVNVRVSDSDQDDFVRNRTTLLGEGRFAFPIWVPACFCVVHLV